MGSVFTSTKLKQPPRRRRYAFAPDHRSSPSPARHVKRHEESVQLRICHYLKKNYPHVMFACDYAAGLDMKEGQRMKMMRMRSDNGMPDMAIYSPSRGYHGLIIELKKEGTVIYKKDGTLRKDKYTRRMKNGTIRTGDHLAEQAACLQRFNDMGYFARFGIGYDNIKKLIDWYFENEQASLF